MESEEQEREREDRERERGDGPRHQNRFDLRVDKMQSRPKRRSSRSLRQWIQKSSSRRWQLCHGGGGGIEVEEWIERRFRSMVSDPGLLLCRRQLDRHEGRANHDERRLWSSQLIVFGSGPYVRSEILNP